MDKQKEIEEMAKILCDNNIDSCAKAYKVGCRKNSCPFQATTRKFVDAGYGNVKKTVKEFAEELAFQLMGLAKMLCGIDGKFYRAVGFSDIVELIEEMLGEPLKDEDVRELIKSEEE